MLKRLLYRNYKLFFLLNQRVKKRFSSHGLMIMAVMFAAGIFGIDTRATLSFQVFSIALITLLLALLYTLFFRGNFTVTRILPDYGTVGTKLQYSLILSNKDSKTYKQLVIIDELKNEFPEYSQFASASDPLDKKRNRIDRYLGYPRLVNYLRKLRGGNIEPIIVNHVTENSDVEIRLEFTPARRGYIYFEKTAIATTDPMGLCYAQKTLLLKNKLLVLPRLYQTPALDLPGHRLYQAGGSNKASLSGDSQEFVSLREYRPGDPLKSIHWRSYARHGVPVVKEYQDEYFVRYGLLLDTYLDSSCDQESFEDAVSIAASFMAGQRQQDTLMDLMFIGSRAYRYTSGKSHHHINSILEVLACIEPEHQSNLVHLQDLLERHINECCGIVCVLLNLDEERRALLRYLDSHALPIKALVLNGNVDESPAILLDNTELYFINREHIQQDLINMSQQVLAA